MRRESLDRLEPQRVWGMFEEITRIPRCSGNEENIRLWVLQWAESRGLSGRTDEGGNVLLSVPASPGCETYPTLVLQAHLDMVCAAESGLSFDFDREPIPLRVEGQFVTTQGTTLGADNGIGIAYALAALSDPTLRHGPLQALFTVGEENGFTGAFALRPGFFTGEYMINLDSEDLGQITIGSAGGEFTDYLLPLDVQEAESEQALELAVDGLQGGHSGLHIHLPRLNAIKTVLHGLSSLRQELRLRLCRFEGGAAANAIPTNSRCSVLVPVGLIERARALLEEWKERTLRDAQKIEPGMRIDIGEVADRGGWTEEQTKLFLSLLADLPQGPLSFSREIEGLVETSVNLGVVRSTADGVELLVNCRSSVNEELSDLSRRLKGIGERHGTRVRQHGRYPGWTANPSSPFNILVREQYEAVLGRRVVLKADHVGLECGVFKGISPALEIASLGPTLKNVHSPGERVDIPSVAIVWEVIRRVIERIDGMRASPPSS
jgi:dipeptidase D